MGLGGLGIHRKIRTIFARPYSVERHWLKRGVTHVNEHFRYNYEPFVVEYLRNVSFDSVLEFGCGFGRITKIILDNFKVQNYTAFDLSPHQIYNTKILCKDYNVDYHISSIMNFNPKKKFDLVIGVDVLMFASPNDVKKTIERLLSFSKKHFIHIDPTFGKQKVTKLTHSFNHNYLPIYEQMESIEIKTAPSGIRGITIYHITKLDSGSK